MFDPKFVRKPGGFVNCGYQTVAQFKKRLLMDIENMLDNVIQTKDLDSLAYHVGVKINSLLDGCEILNEKAKDEKKKQLDKS